jgi:hypothetical protein
MDADLVKRAMIQCLLDLETIAMPRLERDAALARYWPVVAAEIAGDQPGELIGLPADMAMRREEYGKLRSGK